MVFNATFSNILVILLQSFLLEEEFNWSARRKPPTCRKSLTNFVRSGHLGSILSPSPTKRSGRYGNAGRPSVSPLVRPSV
jgi:hypothetical protein